MSFDQKNSTARVKHVGCMSPHELALKIGLWKKQIPETIKGLAEPFMFKFAAKKSKQSADQGRVDSYGSLAG